MVIQNEFLDIVMSEWFLWDLSVNYSSLLDKMENDAWSPVPWVRRKFVFHREKARKAFSKRRLAVVRSLCPSRPTCDRLSKMVPLSWRERVPVKFFFNVKIQFGEKSIKRAASFSNHQSYFLLLEGEIYPHSYIVKVDAMCNVGKMASIDDYTDRCVIPNTWIP